jgi:hypothetical protein
LLPIITQTLNDFHNFSSDHPNEVFNLGGMVSAAKLSRTEVSSIASKASDEARQNAGSVGGRGKKQESSGPDSEGKRLITAIESTATSMSAYVEIVERQQELERFDALIELADDEEERISLKKEKKEFLKKTKVNIIQLATNTVTRKETEVAVDLSISPQDMTDLSNDL